MDDADRQEINREIGRLIEAAARGDEPATIYVDSWQSLHVHVSGWKIQIFMDAGEPDYVEAVTAPDGRSYEYSGLAAVSGADVIDQLPDDVLRLLKAR